MAERGAEVGANPLPIKAFLVTKSLQLNPERRRQGPLGDVVGRIVPN